jgi:hypothetical protein
MFNTEVMTFCAPKGIGNAKRVKEKKKSVKGRKEENVNLLECTAVDSVHFECTESNGNVLLPVISLAHLTTVQPTAYSLYSLLGA